MTLFSQMLRKQDARILALAGWTAWACALPTNNAPPNGTAGFGGLGGGQGGGGGTGNTAAGMTGGTAGGATGGSAAGMTGGTSSGTGGMTGGTTTGGSTTGGSSGSATGGTMAGGGAGGTSGQGGTSGTGGAGMGGSMGGAGTGSGGKGGAGTGGSMGGAGTGSGGKGGTGGMPGVLKHRYSFSGSDTVAVDSVGNMNGTLMNGATQSGGVVNLTGGTSDQYVSLPSNILLGLTAATFEAWASWTGGTSNWQRLFDFGQSDGMGPNGEQGTTNTANPYLFFTPRAQATENPNCTNTTASMPRAAITGSGPANEYCAFGTAAFPTGMTHVAVVVDLSSMSLYINGAIQGSPITAGTPLSAVSGYHAWLGRSLFSADTEFAGTISEFRIYPTARSASQISASASAGPDSVPSQ